MIKIESLSEQHIKEIVEIEEASFSTPWSEQAFIDELTNPLAKYLVAIEGNQVIAYMGMWFIVDEAHITNIAVKPTNRGQGVGKLLLSEAIKVAKEKNCIAMTLEVRESNEKALNMYKQYNFHQVAKRKGYYTNPKEDAIIMWKNL